MTCIVGLTTKSGVILGADSCGSSYNTKQAFKTPKLFRVGKMMFGVAGDYRAAQIVQYSLSVCEPGDDALSYLIREFVPELRKALEDGGRMGTKDGLEDSELTALVGLRGKLFKVQRDASVLEPMNGILAIGSGGEVAYGVLRASTDSPEERIKRALEISGEHTCYVSPPYFIAKEANDWKIEEI